MIQDAIDVCESGYSQQEVSQMEFDIFNSIDWKLSFVSVSEMALFLIKQFRYKEMS